MARRTVIVALMTALSAPAWGWGRDGHRAVCLESWRDMTSQARQAALNLLDINTPEAFAESCSWADDIRRDRPATAPWHFLDVKPEVRRLDLVRDCPQPKSCIVDQIERHSSVLRSKAPKEQRAESLKFLTHFVGDVHQPLHTAIIGDQGGNAIKVTFLGRETNMHAVWDYGLLEAPPPPPDLSYPHLKAALHTLNRKRWNAGTPLEWAQETHWLMRTPATGYLGNPGGLELGDIYIKQNYSVAKEQIEKAGVRLAGLLNDLLR